MATYRNYDGTFTQQRFDERRELFWALPEHLAEPLNQLSLRRCYDLGGIGVTSLLPFFGMLVHRNDRLSGFSKSKEEVGRLCGIHPGTINVAHLEELGIVRYGKAPGRTWLMSHWSDVNRLLAAPKEADGQLHGRWFYFSGRLLWGGQWAMLTGNQRLIYMALAAQAVPYAIAPDLLPFLPAWRYGLAEDHDLFACYHTGPRERELRLARASIGQLERITGLSRDAIKAALRPLKDPELFPNESAADPLVMPYQPLRVYPGERGEPFIYCFRDHVEHWPWDVLNMADGNIKKAAAFFRDLAA